MKHGVKPTKAQKILLKRFRLNIDNWLVIKNTPDHLILIHRHTNKQRIISKQKLKEV